MCFGDLIGKVTLCDAYLIYGVILLTGKISLHFYCILGIYMHALCTYQCQAGEGGRGKVGHRAGFRLIALAWG